MDVLHCSRRTRKAAPAPPIVGERNCRNLRRTLMPCKTPPLPERPPNPPVNNTEGCHNATPACTFCTTHLQITNTFSSVRTQQRFNIRDTFTCKSTNLVYLLDFRKCSDTQYVGETGQRLKDRITQHRWDIKANKHTPVAKHVNSINHTVDDLACTATEQIPSTNVADRKYREKHWRYLLRTCHFPDGLNVWDSV